MYSARALLRIRRKVCNAITYGYGVVYWEEVRQYATNYIQTDVGNGRGRRAVRAIRAEQKESYQSQTEGQVHLQRRKTVTAYGGHLTSK